MTVQEGFSLVRVKVKSKMNVRVKAYWTFSHNQPSTSASHDQPSTQKKKFSISSQREDSRMHSLLHVCCMLLHDAVCVFVQ